MEIRTPNIFTEWPQHIRDATPLTKLKRKGHISLIQKLSRLKIQDYYQNLYKETETWRPNLNLQDFTSINLEEQIWLQRQFEEEEVLKGINLCASDKAPGPDGFPMSFFKEFWSVLKEDILNTMKHFHEFQVFEKSMNATYVALIPKKSGATSLRDFRPISLISGMYKIIAKVLAERLKQVVNKVVNKQMAFIKGRQIMDAALIASECVDTRLRGENAGIMCKLDLEKAYDHVNWGFLLNILRQMRFGDKWLKWIGFCIKTVTSILVNGEPVGFFFI